MKQKVLEILIGLNSEITDNSNVNLVEDGFLDSLDIINLVASLDQEFHIEISGKDIIPENFKDIDSIVNFVKKLQSLNNE